MKLHIIATVFAVLCLFAVYTHSAPTEPADDVTEKSTKKKSGTQTCDDQVQEADSLVKRILLIDYDHMPADREELDELCEIGSTLYKKFKSYSNQCLNGLSKQMMAIFLRGAKKLVRNLCHTPQHKETSLKNFRCSDEAAVAGWNHCMHAANRQFAHVAKNVSDTDIFKYACCMYPTLENCIDDKIKNKPGCKSKPKLKTTFKNMVNTALSDIVEFACAKWDKESCKTKETDVVETLEKIEKSDYKVPGLFIIGHLLDLVPRLTL